MLYFGAYSHQLQKTWVSGMAKEFSAVVKSVRTRLKMSQEGLARKLGVSFATVNRWENSRTKPSRLAQLQFESFREAMRNGERRE